MEDLNKFFASIGLFMSYFIITIIKIFIKGVLIQMMWNVILPDLFSVPKITLYQSVGLLILCILLFDNSKTFRAQRDTQESTDEEN